MNAAGKTVDKTFLSIDQAEARGFLHRDYLAHCLRWSHVCKRLAERKTYQSATILDVGCGRELPMAKMLYSSRLIPRMYFGVDVGPVEDQAIAAISAGKFPHKVWEKTNFLDMTRSDLGCDCEEEQDGDSPNIVTCFEVLEHVEPAMMLDMLQHMKFLASDDARFFISTPCWNRTDCAANHVNEMLYEALGAVFEQEGFVIENVYGTFASIRDYEHLLARDLNNVINEHAVSWHLFNRLREYYDTNFLSCVFAPLFPAQSRNCLWELRNLKPEEEPTKARSRKLKFRPLFMVPEPWGSSALWAQMSR